MKKAALLLVLSMVGSSAFGQQYKTAIGIKGDWSSLNADMAQFSFKHFYSGPNAIEVNLGAGRRYLWLEGMYLFHHPLKSDFDWYAGGGLDFGYWNTNYDGRYDNATRSGFWSGVTGVFGIEYTCGFIPLNFALDAGPTVRALPDFEVGLKIGFAARYAFGAGR